MRSSIGSSGIGIDLAQCLRCVRRRFIAPARGEIGEKGPVSRRGRVWIPGSPPLAASRADRGFLATRLRTPNAGADCSIAAAISHGGRCDLPHVPSCGVEGYRPCAPVRIAKPRRVARLPARKTFRTVHRICRMLRGNSPRLSEVMPSRWRRGRPGGPEPAPEMRQSCSIYDDL